MRRILDVRIIRWQLKLVYVVAAIMIGFPISAVLSAVGVAPLAVSLVNTVVGMALLLLGARIFRGKGEAVAPPRPWWRMTARPTLSRRLGILFMVLLLVVVVGIIFTMIGVEGYRASASRVDLTAVAALGAVEYAVIAYLYLNSAVRLKRLGVPPKEPKFRPTVKLKY